MSTQLIKKMNGLPDSDTEKAIPAVEITESPLNLFDQLPSAESLLPAQLLPYWNAVQQYPLLEGLILLFFFWLLAYLIRRYAISLIARLTSKTQTGFDDQIIAQVRHPIFTTVIWVGVIVASTTAGLTEGWASYITPVVMTIIVSTWLRVSMRLSNTVFTILSREPGRFLSIDVRTEPLFIITSKILALLIAAYIILIIWGINPMGLLASAGVVGIAVGFAAKDTLANLFSGVFILADRPYRLGDYINLDSGERGKVTHIGIRSTRLLTRDDIEITVPNGVIGNAKVVNETGGPHRKMRLRISLQCAYDSNLQQVHDVLMQVAGDNEKVCQHPSPRVRYRSFGDSGINLQLLCWIDEPEGRGIVTHLLYMEIHQAFADHNIEIPYPHLVAKVEGVIGNNES